MGTPVDGDDLIARVSPVLKEERVQICLRPDLIKRWNELDAALTAEVEKAGTNRMVDSGNIATPAAKKLAKEIQALEAEIEGASAWFTFRGLAKDKFRALCSEHPPRDGQQFDQMVGYDRDAVADTLVQTCLIDPVFTEAGWLKFVETCGPSEWSELRDGAFAANGGAIAPPKSQLALQVLSRKGNASG